MADEQSQSNLNVEVAESNQVKAFNNTSALFAAKSLSLSQSPSFLKFIDDSSDDEEDDFSFPQVAFNRNSLLRQAIPKTRRHARTVALSQSETRDSVISVNQSSENFMKDENGENILLNSLSTFAAAFSNPESNPVNYDSDSSDDTVRYNYFLDIVSQYFTALSAFDKDGFPVFPNNPGDLDDTFFSNPQEPLTPDQKKRFVAALETLFKLKDLLSSILDLLKKYSNEIVVGRVIKTNIIEFAERNMKFPDAYKKLGHVLDFSLLIAHAETKLEESAIEWNFCSHLIGKCLKIKLQVLEEIEDRIDMLLEFGYQLRFKNV